MMLTSARNRNLLFISLLVLLLFPCRAQAQQQKAKASGPEIIWAIGHPFVAAKAKRLTKRALQITDSIEKADVFKDRSGGQLDAFKHALWMALLAREIKAGKAYKLGLAHEKYNRKQARKGKGGGDKAASDMDLWNNNMGLKLGQGNKTISEKALIDLVIKAVQQGKMRIIRKNGAGESLDENGKVIDKALLKNWENPRCLVPSNYKYK